MLSLIYVDVCFSLEVRSSDLLTLILIFNALLLFDFRPPRSTQWTLPSLHVVDSQEDSWNSSFHFDCNWSFSSHSLLVWKLTIKSHGHFYLIPGKSVIEILPAIPTAGLTKNDIGELIEKTRTVMNNAYKKLTQQVTSNCDSSINNIDTSDSTKS